MRTLVSGAGAMYHRMAVIASHGIGVVADLPPPKRERIEEFHDFVAFVERVFPALIQQYVAQRDAERAATDGNAGLQVPA
jgi:hypothetical protein